MSLRAEYPPFSLHVIFYHLTVRMHAQAKMPLEIRMWTCDQRGSRHDRDINAAINIRNEAQRMIAVGAVATANGGTVSRKTGRKSSITLVPLKSEAPSFTVG